MLVHTRGTWLPTTGTCLLDFHRHIAAGAHWTALLPLIRESRLRVGNGQSATGALIGFYHPVFRAYLENFHLYTLHLFSESAAWIASAESAADDQIVKIRKRPIRLDLSGEDGAVRPVFPARMENCSDCQRTASEERDHPPKSDFTLWTRLPGYLPKRTEYAYP
jgi:hypothetical protein